MTAVGSASETGWALSPPVAQAKPLGVLGATRIVLRWSPLVLPLVAASIYFAISLTSSIQPEYTAQASMLLTGPNELRTIDFETGEVFVEDVNPLSLLGGSLSTVAEVTALSLTDSATSNELEDENLTTVYNVWNESRSPIINAEAIDSDPALAADTVTYLLGLIGTDLEDRQNELEAPLTNRISAQPIDDVSVSDADFSGRNRTRIGLAGVGVALSIASAFLFEGLYQLYRRYRARRSERLQAEEESAGGLDELRDYVDDEIDPNDKALVGAQRRSTPSGPPVGPIPNGEATKRAGEPGPSVSSMASETIQISLHELNKPKR